MFSKILIANRGEIALRIARSCREMGIRTVAVYSEADEESLHLNLADETVCIGPPDSRKSYLNAERILDAAKKTGAEAIHPGYGYLAESATFAAACLDQGLVFIGPTPDNLRLAGDKIVARKIMEKAGVPVIPGSRGPVGSLKGGRDRSGTDRVSRDDQIRRRGRGPRDQDLPRMKRRWRKSFP